MKKIKICAALAFALLFVIGPIAGFAAVKISKVSGEVSVFQNGKWVVGKPDLPVVAQDTVKTGPGSKAELLYDDTSRIWISENSEVRVGWVGEEGLLDLLVGKIRAKMKLLSGRKFSVKSPSAVVSIRGTEFVFTDKGDLFVMEGLVQFANAVGNSNADIGAGQYSGIDQAGAAAPAANMTDEQKSSLEKEWSGFENMKAEATPAPQEQQKASDQKKEELKAEMAGLRQEIRDVVGTIKADIIATREIASEIKESDFSTGRSLRDIHGNLVRVEQYLLRPDNRTLQFVNLTKRNEYVYKGRFSYSGPATGRVDLFDANISFSKDLPQQLTDWPSFMSDQTKDENKDTFFPESMKVTITNQTDKLEMIGVSKEAGQLDEKGNVLTDRRIVSDAFINGWKVDVNYDTGDPSRPEYDPTDKAVDVSGESTDDLWATVISPKIKLDQAGQPSQYVRFYNESYAINNNGKILNLKDFTSSSENPFTLLKTVAAEGIVACRRTDGTDFFSKGNIDLIMTPDMVLSIAQKLATQATSISDSFK
jgi:hypothetical protein